MKSDLSAYLFSEGRDCRAYNAMGAHFAVRGKRRGVSFRVWAPGAGAVSVVGDFNGWDSLACPMRKIPGTGLWETFVPGLRQYDAYKYSVTGRDGRARLKADPFAFHAETPPGTASKIYDLSGYRWGDGAYMRALRKADVYRSPLTIYEVHVGSWKRYPDGSPYGYRALAKTLVPYVKRMGYNCLELMPVTEYPYDGSWGYQVTGYFAATSRYGTPHDFMYFVDACHRAGLRVILDWVPAHFPKDAHGLYEFDGGPLYESGAWDRMEHKGWGTRRFDYGRAEVQSFLISSAEFWLEKFHVDGLRVDAVAAMLYLDYDKQPGEWLPNAYGENKNLEAIAFLRKLNEAVFRDFPYAIMAAEESTAWPMVTRPVSDGGLGFNFKWNMGWMNDILSYCALDPLFRRGDHNKLTFPMMYAFSENFILPVSHDEVVHGKKSLLDRMPGDYADKFAGVRTFLGYMTAHPGKKLMFMGAEFGQFKEWNYAEGLEFFLCAYDAHRKLLRFFRELNALYLARRELWEIEDGWAGFEWLSADDRDANTVAFERRSADGRRLIAVINFSGAPHKNYWLGIEEGGYRVIFNSDSEKYGGTGTFRKRIVRTQKKSANGKPCSLVLDLPKLSFLYLEPIE